VQVVLIQSVIGKISRKLYVEVAII